MRATSVPVNAESMLPQAPTLTLPPDLGSGTSLGRCQTQLRQSGRDLDVSERLGEQIRGHVRGGDASVDVMYTVTGDRVRPQSCVPRPSHELAQGSTSSVEREVCRVEGHGSHPARGQDARTRMAGIHGSWDHPCILH
jgi:hypothetical protein